jgi:hypothetical protein
MNAMFLRKMVVTAAVAVMFGSMAIRSLAQDTGTDTTLTGVVSDPLCGAKHSNLGGTPETSMPKCLPKLAMIVSVILMAFVSYSLGSKQSDTTANDQLKVDVLTLPQVPGNNPGIPRVARDYSKLTPPAKEVLFALVSVSTLVVPQGALHTSEEVGQHQTNIFI